MRFTVKYKKSSSADIDVKSFEIRGDTKAFTMILVLGVILTVGGAVYFLHEIGLLPM